jgi:hypothetical protein
VTNVFHLKRQKLVDYIGNKNEKEKVLNCSRVKDKPIMSSTTDR